MWVNGRRDATISVMGANIYPEDVEAVLYGDPEVAPRLHSFLLSVVDDEAGTPRPEISLELTDLHGVDEAWRQARAESFAVALAKLNMDFRSSRRGVPQRDAADRPDLRPRRGPVPRRRAPDQAAADRDRVVRRQVAGTARGSMS